MNEIDIARDALGLIAAAAREDAASVETMISTFNGPGNDAERGMLVGALLAHSVAILNLASQTLGVDPASILGSVAVSLNETP
jgi:hypothetical protein